MYKTLVKLASRGQIRSLICAEPIPNNILCFRCIIRTNRPNPHPWFTRRQQGNWCFLLKNSGCFSYSWPLVIVRMNTKKPHKLPPSSHLQHHHPKAVHISLDSRNTRINIFRSKIPHCPCRYSSIPRATTMLIHLRKPKIPKLGIEIGIKHYVAGLHIPMNDLPLTLLVKKLVEAPIGEELINEDQLIPLTAPALKLNEILVAQVTHHGGKLGGERVVQTVQIIIIPLKSLDSHVPSKGKVAFINLGRSTLPNKPITVEPHGGRLNLRNGSGGGGISFVTQEAVSFVEYIHGVRVESESLELPVMDEVKAGPFPVRSGETHVHEVLESVGKPNAKHFQGVPVLEPCSDELAAVEVDTAGGGINGGQGGQRVEVKAHVVVVYVGKGGVQGGVELHGEERVAG
ncbi:hypothetical protein CR513_35818, partial [Mucuna pruriens]